MRNFRKQFGPLLIVGAALFIAGCQGVASTGGGGAIASAPSASAPASSPPASRATPGAIARAPTPKAPAGLKLYKTYSTTENLCAQTCKSEARCQSQTFKPLQEINGYIAGQCSFYGQ